MVTTGEWELGPVGYKLAPFPSFRLHGLLECEQARATHCCCQRAAGGHALPAMADGISANHEPQ